VRGIRAEVVAEDSV